MTHQATIDGIDRIERDHRRLGRLIDKLQAALSKGANADEIALQRCALTEYLESHMAFEEALMAERCYPLTFTHTEQHQAFRDQVASILAGIDSGTVTPGNVGKLLKKIHTYHTRYFDETLCHYLMDKYALQSVAEGAGI